jgi:hypothetical protein
MVMNGQHNRKASLILPFINFIELDNGYIRPHQSIFQLKKSRLFYFRRVNKARLQPRSKE